ncbi:cytosol aminopeptidase catalytic domain containing family protein [Babesia caballi]|uniref:Cytosol aminopeptidase catalytic domain containing family protein n=1 Tax=Babesia caballi TaxID=5871 RepID=A0AAV4M0H9_BABCB|nr:cytosol aminopeptidase catalytic domain containing family protein [Babesia caballi]
MGARLINCVRSANSLISDIRKSPALSEDLDDVSMHQAADALDKFFLQFLVLLTCFRVVEGWIVLCKCMDKVLKGCAEVVKAWKEKRRCSSASLSHGDAKGLSICGCVCLIKLADCCKTLHEKQCEIVEEILNSSPSTNHPMPSVAHTRSLTLLVYCFGAVMKSKLASESGDCKCKQSTKRVDQCDCCRYSGRLFDLLSRWLRDVSSMGFGDTLLRETIELFSYVVSPDTTNNNETYPNVMQRLHKFVGVSRSTAMQAYKLRGSTNTTTDVDHQVGNFINVGPGLKEVPQFCCTCEQKCTQDSCYCYLMECEYSKNNDKCSLEILTKLHTLKDAAKLENIKQCLTNMSGTLKSVSDKLKGASSAAQKDLYCVDGTVSKVKSFFEKSIGDDSHTTASGHSGKAMFCSVACTNKQLAVFLLYNCNSAANNHVSTSDNCASGSGAASTSHQACSGDLCGKCADPNCKSLYCTISRLTCTLYGNGTAEQHQTQCNCTKKDSTNSCCCGTNSLCSILCECSSKLDELKKKLGDNAGLVTEVQHTCDKVSDVKMEMGEITKCLKVFAAECQYYEEHLDSTQATIYYLFREEIDHIRDLQKFLDENCEAYEAAVSSMTKVVSSTAALSSQHQRDVFFLDTEVDKVTKNVNATCDRATSIQDELAKCMAGLDAEKRSIVMAPKTYQPLVHRNSEKRLPLGISTLKESMWYFDMLWMFCFGFCLLYSWYYSSSKSWLYHTARNFIVLLAIKGIMTLNSYLLVLCGFRRHQSYLINIALFIGFLIAICMSWVSQWWNYTLFLRENCKPIEHWFRFVYPNTMASTGSGSLTWFRGIVSLMSADFNYLKSLLTSASFEGYHYNPFGTIFDDYFRLQNRPIGYLGACDWNSFNTELRQDLIVAAKKGKLQCLLDYLAFKSASEVDWSFLFGATTFNIDKFPTDLLWAAWNMHEKLTLERCVSYSLLEAAYTRVYNSIKAVVDSANGDDEQLPLVLDDFDTEQRNYLAYNAISVPNFTDLQGTAGQMDSLFKFFEDDFKQEWYDYYSYISSTTDDVPDTREGTSTSSDADKTMIIDRTKLEEAVETWRTKRTDACENIYGGSAVCHRLVTSTVAMLERYLSELRQTGKAYSPFKLLKFCDSYVNQDFIGDHNDIREIADSTPSSNGPSDESTVSETGREFDPSGEHSYDYTSINLGVRQKVTISEQHELLEMYDLQHFLLGFWLKHAGVSVTTTDVKQVLTFLYSESRVL